MEDIAGSSFQVKCLETDSLGLPLHRPEEANGSKNRDAKNEFAAVSSGPSKVSFASSSYNYEAQNGANSIHLKDKNQRGDENPKLFSSRTVRMRNGVGAEIKNERLPSNCCGDKS